MDAYFRAANYLSAEQIYLKENPLLKEPLKGEHIKKRLLGHWGTSPELNFIYVHLNRLIQDTKAKMIYITGPGHGGLNFSSLDGWWAEAYTPDVGWAIKGDDDGEDAKTLLDTLENEIIPLFYHRDAQGIPQEWLKKVKTSMARLTPEYSTNRMVRDYVEHYYL